ncbi:phenoloxidase-activating factor 2 isoform 1-T1 [Glossina fuscipes fuscipes]
MGWVKPRDFRPSNLLELLGNLFSFRFSLRQRMAAKLILLVSCALVAQVHSQVTLDELIKGIFTTKKTTDVDPPPTVTIRTAPMPNPDPTPAPTPAPTSNPDGNRTGQFGKYKSCGLNKECVPRHLCVDGTISTTGENFIDIRIDGDVCIYNEACCDLPNKRTKSVIPALPPEPHDGCGWRNQNGVGFKISIKQDEAEFGEFPWMLAILRVEENGDNDVIFLYECGGSLIAPNVALTAAHCVINREARQLIVRAGEWDTQNTNEILPHVDKQVKEKIVHEKYSRGTLYNDVALLILEEPYRWEENIRPVCLPESNTNFDGLRCFATGWGKDKFGREGKYQVILKRIDLPVVPHATCEDQIRQTRLGLYYELHESFMCAGGELGKDTCKGDGGSPLICPIPGVKDRYYQAGIVAWGIGCNEVNVPGVYASIPYARQWISDKLISRSVNFDHFTP